MKRNLFKIQDLVQDILEKNIRARGNDNYLYREVCQRLNCDVLGVPLGAVLVEFDRYNIPSIESVGRARRKLQAQYPELRPTKEVEQMRYEQQIAFEQYARCEVR